MNTMTRAIIVSAKNLNVTSPLIVVIISEIRLSSFSLVEAYGSTSASSYSSTMGIASSHESVAYVLSVMKPSFVIFLPSVEP